MLRRTFAVLAAHLREASRSPLAWLGALALLLAIPAITLSFGGDAASRAWLARSLVSEGLRMLLPLAGLMGAAYIIRPSPRRGWAILPVRRSEWFMGSALACCAFLALGAAVLVTGGVAAGALLGDAATLERVRYAEEMKYLGPREADGERLFVLPATGERLEFTFDGEGLGETIEGKLQFEIAWTMEQAPDSGTPLEITLKGEREVVATTHVEARRRATFKAPHPGGGRIAVIARAIDPALSVGMKREECRLVLGRENAAPSLLWLGIVGLCGALLCAGVTLCVRSLSTAPTAALAGALLLAALTLLPALGPGDLAARARRRDVEGEKAREKSTLQSLGETLSALPPLNEPQNFERVLAGEATRADDATAALLRLAAALTLLPLGAALFARRQIT